MRALLRAGGLADFLDVNIPVGKLHTQIQLIKRLLNQAGIADLLDVDLNKSSLAKAAAEVQSLSATIPVTFDVSHLPVLGPVGDLTEKVTVDTGSAAAAIAALKARMAALSETLTDLRVGLDDAGAVAKIAALQAKLAAIAKFTGSIALTADTSRLDAAIITEEAKLAVLQARASDLSIDFSSADLAKMDTQITAAQMKIVALQAKSDDIRLAFTVDEAGLLKADAQLLAMKALTQKMAATVIPLKFDITGLPVGGETVSMTERVNTAAAQAALTGLDTKLIQTSLDAIAAAKAASGYLDPALAQTSLRAVAAQQALTEMGADLLKLDAVLKETAAIEMELAAADDLLAGQSDRLSKNFRDIGAAAGLTAIATKSLDTELKEKPADMAAAAGATKFFGASLFGLTAGLAGLGGWWGALNTKIQLFGGVLAGTSAAIAGHVAVWHILLDAAIETTTAFAGLAIGLMALGAAIAIFIGVATQAGDTLGRINDRAHALITATTALNQNMYPLTNTFDKLQGVIRPEVWELLGDAINVVSGQTGLLGSIAEKTGAVLDRVAGRVVAFIDNPAVQQGFSALIKTGTGFAEQFGRIFLNLGTVFYNFIKAAELTHIAQDLGAVINAVAKLAAIITSAIPTWLLALALGLHGAWIWGGLFSSMIIAMLSPLRALALGLGGITAASTAMASLPEDATGLSRLGAIVTDIGAGIGGIPARISGAVLSLQNFGAGAEEAGVEAEAAGPAIAAMAVEAEGSAFSFAAMGAGEEVAAAGGLTLTGVLSGLGAAMMALLANPITWFIAAAAAIAVIAVKIITAKDATQQWIGSLDAALAKSTIYTTIGNTITDLAGVTQNLATAQAGGAGNARELSAAQSDLSGKLTDELTHVADISHAYGTTFVGALALLNAAQVTTGQLQTSQNNVWKGAEAQVAGLVTGYKAMGIAQAGATAELQNAVTVQLVANAATAPALGAMQKLNGYWDDFATIVSAPVSGVLAVASSLDTFNTDAKAAGASMSGLSGVVTGESKNMTNAAIQLQQDFQSTLGDVEQLFDSFRNSQAVSGSGDFIGFAKDAVAALIPLAGTNKAAAAQISVLAQEAGGPATTSLTALAKWAGNVKDPMDKLYSASETAAVNVSNLNLDAQQLSSTLENDLNPAMASAAFNALGGQKNFATFADDLEKFGPGSQTTITAAGAVAQELLAIDKNSVSAQAQFVGMAESMGYSQVAADKLWDSAVKLSSTAYKITIQDNITAEQTKIKSLYKQLGETTDPAKKHLINLEIKVDTGKLADMKDSLNKADQPADKLRASLAGVTTAGDNLAESGFWGQVRDKITNIIGFAEKHPIATLLFGTSNFIPGFTATMDKAGAVISRFFTKTVPDAAKDTGKSISGAWSSVYTSFMRTVGSPLTAWFTTSFPHAIATAWDTTWSGLVTPVVHAFDAVKSAITGGFDGWWKTHGMEVEQVWTDVTNWIRTAWDKTAGLLVKDGKIIVTGFAQIVDAIRSIWDGMFLYLSSAGNVFARTWDGVWAALAPIVKIAISAIETAVKVGWAVIAGITKIVWDAVVTVVKDAWDVLAAVVRVGVAAVEAIIKIAWDLIVGIFSVALDLITGHWSTTWKDIERAGEQIWNSIFSFYKSAFSSYSTLFEQVFNNTVSFWKDTWSTVKSTAESAWNSILAFLKTVWSTILTSAESFWGSMKTGFDNVVSSIRNTWDTLKGIFSGPVNFLINTVYTGGIERLWNDVIAKLGGPAMPNVSGLASGGKILAGTTSKADDVLARVSRGETVVSAADSQKLAPYFTAVGVPGYAAGGIPGGGVVHNIAHAASDVAGDISSFVTGAIGKAVDATKIAAALATGNQAALTSALEGLLGNTGTGGAAGILAQTMASAPGHVITAAVKAVWSDLLSKVKSGAAASAASAGAAAPGNLGANAALMKSMAAARGWTGAQWNALYDVEMREAGFSLTAQNPTSGAYGMAQFINGPSEYAQYGGNASTAAGQITAMLNYIAQRYGTPEGAWAHEESAGWYAKGGVPAGLAAAQVKEAKDYASAVRQAGTPPGTEARKELARLIRDQSYETGAFGNLESGGTTAGNLSWFKSQLSSMQSESASKDITLAAPAAMTALHSELGTLLHLASGIAPASKSSSGSSSSGTAGTPAVASSAAVKKMTAGQIAKQGAAYLKSFHGQEINPKIDWWNAELSRDSALTGASGLSKAQVKHYKSAVVADKKMLAALAGEKTVLQEWRADLSGSDSSLSSWISAAGKTPSLANNVKTWKHQLAGQENEIAGISKMLGWSAAQIAAQEAAAAAASAAAGSSSGDSSGSPATTITPVGLTPAGALAAFTAGISGTGAKVIPGYGGSFDQGGTLATGWNTVHNGTGRPEPLVPARRRANGLSTDAEAIIAALRENTMAVQQGTTVAGTQGTQLGRALNGQAPAKRALTGAGSLRRMPL